MRSWFIFFHLSCCTACISSMLPLHYTTVLLRYSQIPLCLVPIVLLTHSVTCLGQKSEIFMPTMWNEYLFMCALCYVFISGMSAMRVHYNTRRLYFGFVFTGSRGTFACFVQMCVGLMCTQQLRYIVLFVVGSNLKESMQEQQVKSSVFAFCVCVCVRTHSRPTWLMWSRCSTNVSFGSSLTSVALTGGSLTC